MRRAIYAFIAIAILAFVAGFPAYLAFGQGGGGSSGVTVAITATPVIGGGGGGGGGGVTVEEGGGCPPGEVSAAGRTTLQGLIIKTIIVIDSFDGRFRLTIDEGITALTYTGLCLKCIGIHQMEGSPSLPEGAYLIGIMYDVVPDEATFSPPATLRYRYDPATIPEGVPEEKLLIASYDEMSGKWIQLDSVVDTEAKTITTTISRWTDLAVFGYGVEAPPPADFQVSSLGISPTEVYTGEAVDITILVTNTGGQSAGYQVVLKINGAPEITKEVVLDAGASEWVSFTTTKEIAGTYSVDINGISGAFEVKPIPPEPFNWWIIAAAIAGVALAALLTHIIRAQKTYGGVTAALSVDAISVEVRRVISLVTQLALKAVAAIYSLLNKFNNLIKKK